MVKDVKIYFIGLKKDLFGCFRIEEIRDKDNEIRFDVGKRNRNVKLQCFPYTRLHSLSSLLNYLPGITM